MNKKFHLFFYSVAAMFRTTLKNALQTVERGLNVSASRATRPGFVYPVIGTTKGFHSADSTLAPRGGGALDGHDEIRPRILITGWFVCNVFILFSNI